MLQLIASTILAFTCLATVATADERPNVVLILADDLGYETVGCYGGSSYATPNLDRLASQGLRFDRAYAMPLCTNTRIQLMTGKYNIRNWKAFGILDPAEITFGHLMRQAGYKTCIAGKWQMTSYDPPDYPGAALRRNTGTHPRDAGFDEYCAVARGPHGREGFALCRPGDRAEWQDTGQTQRASTGLICWTDFINDFIEQNQSTSILRLLLDGTATQSHGADARQSRVERPRATAQ